MTIPGHPLPPSTPLVATHWHFLSYLQTLIKSHNLQPHIHCNHRVLNSFWSKDHWEVDIAINGSFSERRQYDHLVVASGRDQVPKWPVIPGETEWRREGRGHRVIQHSKWFRGGELLEGKFVVVVGDAASGQAVAEQAVPYASKVKHHFVG